MVTQIPTILGDEGNKILMFLAHQIAERSWIWTNFLTIISNFVASKSVLVSTLVTSPSNLFIKFTLLCSDYLLISID